ncbi:hypothetical protein C8J56DRAFT_1162845 [Mycena floridula]|nr:hypothetical protein C8J56DRAFT_1162845 [Mycena floridula]
MRPPSIASSDTNARSSPKPRKVHSPESSKTTKSPRYVPRTSGPSNRFREERERIYQATPQATLIELLIKEEFQVKETRKLLNAALKVNSSSQRVSSAENERRKPEPSQLDQTLRMAQVVTEAQDSITKAQVEATTYKIQLEHAQLEMEKAQSILRQVEAQRQEAQRSAARAKDVARRLKEEKAMILARESGRREGYEDGLLRGRMAALAQAEEARLLSFPDISRDIGPGSAFIEEQEDVEPPPVQQARSKSKRPSSRRPREPEPREHRRSRRKSPEARPRHRRHTSTAPSASAQATASSATPNAPVTSTSTNNRAARVTSPTTSTNSNHRRNPSATAASTSNGVLASEPIRVAPTLQAAAAAPPPVAPVMREQAPLQPIPPQPIPPQPIPAPVIFQNPPMQYEPVTASALAQSVSGSHHNATLHEGEVSPAPVRTEPRIGYLRMPSPPSMPGPSVVAPQPTIQLQGAGITQRNPQIVVTEANQGSRSSPERQHSPASSHTSMTGLSSHLGSHLLSFPSSITGARGLSAIPEDVSQPPAPVSTWANEPVRSLDKRRSVEEWRNTTAAPRSGSIPASASGSRFTTTSSSSNFLQPPQPMNSGSSQDGLHRRGSNSSHSIEFNIVPPSRPSSVDQGDPNQVSGYLSPNHTPMNLSSDPNEPPVIPSGFSTSSSSDDGAGRYSSQPNVPVIDPAHLPPGFVPQVLMTSPDAGVDLASGKYVATPPAWGMTPNASGSHQQTSRRVYQPFPPPPMTMPVPFGSSEDVEGLTSTFGSFALGAGQGSPSNAGRSLPKGILVNGSNPQHGHGLGMQFPRPQMTPSRSAGEIGSPGSSISDGLSPRRRGRSLNAGKTPLSIYHNLQGPGPSNATPGPIYSSPLVFARPPGSESSVASRRSPFQDTTVPFIPPNSGLGYEPSMGPGYPGPSMMPSYTVPVGSGYSGPSVAGPSFPAPSYPPFPRPLSRGGHDSDTDTGSFLDPMTLANTEANSRRTWDGPGGTPQGMPSPGLYR